jgi:hypothetical protein
MTTEKVCLHHTGRTVSDLEIFPKQLIRLRNRTIPHHSFAEVLDVDGRSVACFWVQHDKLLDGEDVVAIQYNIIS